MAYGGIPLQGYANRARKSFLTTRLLFEDLRDTDTADSLVWNAWVFQPNTNATAAVTLGTLTVSATGAASDPPVATLSVTLGDLTLDATAAAAPSGTLAVTLGGIIIRSRATLGPRPITTSGTTTYTTQITQAGSIV